MKKQDVINNNNATVAICDPWKYKGSPLSAKKAKIVGAPESDGRCMRVDVADDAGEVHSVTLAEIRCLWSEHEAQSGEFAKEAEARTTAAKAELAARQERAKGLIEALAVAGLELKVDKDAKRLTLSLDQAQGLVDVMFPAEEADQAQAA